MTNIGRAKRLQGKMNTANEKAEAAWREIGDNGARTNIICIMKPIDNLVLAIQSVARARTVPKSSSEIEALCAAATKLIPYFTQKALAEL